LLRLIYFFKLFIFLLFFFFFGLYSGEITLFFLMKRCLDSPPNFSYTILFLIDFFLSVNGFL